MKKAIVDTSSVILLYKSGLLDELIRTYHVSITASVYKELTVNDYPGSLDIINHKNKNGLSVVPLTDLDYSNHDRLIAQTNLGRGEMDTIILFDRGCADFIIIDDKKGAVLCRDSSLPYINALLFPRILFLHGYFSKIEFKDYTEKIVRFGRYSDKIIDFVMNCSREDMKFFLP